LRNLKILESNLMNLETLLQNKVAIITGASRGIGRATTLALARAGAAVVLAARHSQAIQELAEEIRADGGQALAVPTDVTSQTAVNSLIILTMRAFGQIDILVNNAGVINPIGKAWEVPAVEWESLIKINVLGPYLCARAVLSQQIRRGQGRIINISSRAATVDMPGWSAYCASKAALDRFTTVLAAEVAETEIVVAGVYPGSVDTQMQLEIRQTNLAAFPRRDHFRQLHQEGRLYQPEESAQLILWLASEFGADQNGAILNLNDEALRKGIARDLARPLIPAQREA